MDSFIKTAVNSGVLDTVARAVVDHSNHDHSNHGNMGMSGSDMSGMTHEAMSPYLFANMKDFFILFREAKVTNGGGLAGAIFGSIVFTLLATIFSSYSKTIENKSASSTARFDALSIAATLSFAFRMFLHYIAMLLVSRFSISVYLLIPITQHHYSNIIPFIPSSDHERMDHPRSRHRSRIRFPHLQHQLRQYTN